MANGSYRRRRRPSIWLAVLICLVAMELGGHLGIFLSQWEQFSWSGIALEVGTENPWIIMTPLHEASILIKTRFNLGSVFGLSVGILLYSLIRRR